MTSKEAHSKAAPGEAAQSVPPATTQTAVKRHLRIDTPTRNPTATADPLMWSLQEELAREMSSRLSVISSCLGICQLLTSGRQDASHSGKLQVAIAMANEAISRASQINRSSRCLNRLQSDHTTAHTINHSLDDALQILQHKLQIHDIVVDLQRQPTAGVTYQSPELPQVLVALVDSLVERLRHQPVGKRVLSITTSVQRNHAEILLSCATVSQDAELPAPQRPAALQWQGGPPPSPTQQLMISGQRGEDLARSASKRLGGNVRFGKTRLGGQAYSILLGTEQGLQRQEGQI